MLFLIRIVVQRLILVAYSALAFLGIAPEATIPTTEQAQQVIEDRRAAFSDILGDKILADNLSVGLGQNIENIKINVSRIARDGSSNLSEEKKKELIDDLREIADVKEDPVDISEEDLDQILQYLANELEEARREQVEQKIATTSNPKTQEVYETLEDYIETLNKSYSKNETDVTNPIKEVSDVVKGDSSSAIENVILNTVCTRKSGNTLNVTTGSAVLISPKGVVLTNAHVAQYFLIQDYDNNIVDCALYKENIPTFGYKAKVLHLSNNWISKNYKAISESSPVGTGEGDYALLYIYKNTNPAIPLPEEFPYANLIINSIPEGADPVTAAGYPGSPESILNISSAGNLQIDDIFITNVYTFSNGNIDIVTTTPTPVGARGSSGGGIFEGHQKNISDLLGIIVTTTQSRINALTISYINSDLKADTGLDLEDYLSGNIDSKITGFQNSYLEPFAELLIPYLPQ
jgi:hypothetical protein